MQQDDQLLRDYMTLSARHKILKDRAGVLCGYLAVAAAAVPAYVGMAALQTRGHEVLGVVWALFCMGYLSPYVSMRLERYVFRDEDSA